MKLNKDGNPWPLVMKHPHFTYPSSGKMVPWYFDEIIEEGGIVKLTYKMKLGMGYNFYGKTGAEVAENAWHYAVKE